MYNKINQYILNYKVIIKIDPTLKNNNLITSEANIYSLLNQISGINQYGIPKSFFYGESNNQKFLVL